MCWADKEEKKLGEIRRQTELRNEKSATNGRREEEGGDEGEVEKAQKMEGEVGGKEPIESEEGREEREKKQDENRCPCRGSKPTSPASRPSQNSI